jgi:hypothetical protein
VRRLVISLVVLLGAASARAEGRSPNNASYDIDVKLDPAKRTLDGREVITWTNIQEKPTSQIWLHLYWNGWRNNRSTWMRELEARGRRQPEELGEGDWGRIDIAAIKLLSNEAAVDLRPNARPAAPDDGNPTTAP